MFFVFEILAFLAGKCRTNLAPNFSFANMGYLMLLFERYFQKDLKTEKKVFKYVYPIKRYNILKFEFLLFLVTTWREIQIFKTFISFDWIDIS